MRLNHGYISAILLIVIVALAPPLYSQWQETGTTISTVTGDEEFPTIVSNGAGGAIIAWQTYLSQGDNPDIYAQMVDADGYTLWAEGGISVCSAANAQHKPEIISDGEGGAIVAWSDFRTGNADVYAQRIDADGNALWQADGIAVCTALNSFGWWIFSRIRMLELAGGAIITWYDDRNGNYDIYAQRIDADGNNLWTPDGVSICSASGDQTITEIVSDGSGGAVIAWIDERNGNYDIYAQRISADGSAQWTPGGVAVCTDSGDQRNHTITTDGAGGAIISWRDGTSEEADIYAQRIDADGVIRWAPRGVAVCTASRQQDLPQAASDCSGGAIVAWSDNRNAEWWDHEIYAQRVSPDGSMEWAEGGIRLSERYHWDHTYPRIIPDGYGGAVICWVTGESLPGMSHNALNERASSDTVETVYAQRVASDGSIWWEENGLPLCTFPESWCQLLMPRLTTDGAGGAIVTWFNNYRYIGIYAQRVSGNGNAPPTSAEAPPLRYFLAQNFPNPFNPSTRIVFETGRSGRVSLKIYDPSGRLIRVLVDEYREASTYEEVWDGTDNHARPVSSGIYFCRLKAGTYIETKKTVLIR